MRRRKKCRHCRRWYTPHPQTHRHQKVCSKENCQTERKKRAQRRWRSRNPHYDDGREENLRTWRRHHPGYWKEYRARHPAYVRRNRKLQHRRNAKNRGLIAKQDAWSSLHAEKIARIRRLGLIAKRDACRVPLTRQTEEICRYLSWFWLIAKRDDTDGRKTLVS